MREKLIEFIRKADKEDYLSRTQDEHYAFMDDHLIANSVTLDNQVSSSKWISVSERLPEPGDYVLVCDTRVDWYGLLEFSGAAWYDAGYKPWDIDEVTHWMPLPSTEGLK